MRRDKRMCVAVVEVSAVEVGQYEEDVYCLSILFCPTIVRGTCTSQILHSFHSVLLYEYSVAVFSV